MKSEMPSGKHYSANLNSLDSTTAVMLAKGIGAQKKKKKRLSKLKKIIIAERRQGADASSNHKAKTTVADGDCKEIAEPEIEVGAATLNEAVESETNPNEDKANGVKNECDDLDDEDGATSEHEHPEPSSCSTPTVIKANDFSPSQLTTESTTPLDATLADRPIPPRRKKAKVRE
jgi:hypothetical protein